MSATTSAIESVLVENRVFPPADAVVKAARISGMAGYEALCKEAEADFEGFWAKQARANVQWTKPFTRTLDESNAPFFRWFDDGELNASANCLDKHIGTPTENKTAIIFEADDGAVTKITYKELLARVSQFANALKAHGVEKGDRVLIYMPMTIEGVVPQHDQQQIQHIVAQNTQHRRHAGIRALQKPCRQQHGRRAAQEKRSVIHHHDLYIARLP